MHAHRPHRLPLTSSIRAPPFCLLLPFPRPFSTAVCLPVPAPTPTPTPTPAPAYKSTSPSAAPAHAPPPPRPAASACDAAPAAHAAVPARLVHPHPHPHPRAAPSCSAAPACPPPTPRPSPAPARVVHLRLLFTGVDAKDLAAAQPVPFRGLTISNQRRHLSSNPMHLLRPLLELPFKLPFCRRFNLSRLGSTLRCGSYATAELFVALRLVPYAPFPQSGVQSKTTQVPPLNTKYRLHHLLGTSRSHAAPLSYFVEVSFVSQCC
ncbi:hypothetical protein C8J57DRAFT_1705466 [Mycena rebaudengoi]|nr:hypothetical protein C8J57DRAFT_1705466 [Mycena rebaudengoi]